MEKAKKVLEATGSGTGVVNLALLLVIGWNARSMANEIFDTVEENARITIELRSSVGKLQQEVTELKSADTTRRETRETVLKLSTQVAEMATQLSKVSSCMREGRRKCDV